MTRKEDRAEGIIDRMIPLRMPFIDSLHPMMILVLCWAVAALHWWTPEQSGTVAIWWAAISLGWAIPLVVSFVLWLIELKRRSDATIETATVGTGGTDWSVACGRPDADCGRLGGTAICHGCGER